MRSIGGKIRALFCLLGILAAEAQQTPPNNPPVRFQTSTQLVVETVSVTDKSGKPIEGLTARDFTITEDGVPQVISFCEYQKMQETAPAVAATPQPAPDNPVPAV